MTRSSCLLAMLFISSQAFSFANIELNMKDVNTYTHKNTHIIAEIEYGIQNNTYDPQTYVIKYSLCPENRECFSGSFPVSLRSTEREQKKFKISTQAVYGQPRVYRATLIASISGESISYKETFSAINVYQR